MSFKHFTWDKLPLCLCSASCLWFMKELMNNNKYSWSTNCFVSFTTKRKSISKYVCVASSACDVQYMKCYFVTRCIFVLCFPECLLTTMIIKVWMLHLYCTWRLCVTEVTLTLTVQYMTCCWRVEQTYTFV